VTSQPLPTEAEVRALLRDRSNWGRWGPDDQLGAVNLITAAKRVQAAGLVRSGRAVSLSRPLPTTPAANNPNPAQHFLRFNDGPDGGGATDYYGTSYHGLSTTHLDALCHMWGEHGMWNGRKPAEVTPAGTNWGGVQAWSDGIVTRGVLLDIPKLRGEPYVTLEKPVHGWDLAAAAKAQGVALQPGDALIVNCGREAYEREAGPWGADPWSRPGLHASCLPFIRDADVAVLVWDMLDFRPTGYTLNWGVHPVLFSFGVCLIDNARLDDLARACQGEGRYDFMLTLAPLVVTGGTGSPLNPIALF